MRKRVDESDMMFPMVYRVAKATTLMKRRKEAFRCDRKKQG